MFFDYCLDSWFQVYVDNNPLTYDQLSKLGVLQAQWLSEVALFNFTIKYQTGHSKKATGALSCCPFNPDTDHKSKINSDEVGVISYSPVCKAVDRCFDSSNYQMTSRKKHNTSVVQYSLR